MLCERKKGSENQRLLKPSSLATGFAPAHTQIVPCCGTNSMTCIHALDLA
jgi:hypothetical protein